MEQQPCKECHRALRPTKTKASDYPGTVAHWGQGYCRTCFGRIRPEPIRTDRPDDCLVCEKPLRGSHSKPSEFPGTVRHKAYGKCINCYRKDNPRELDTSDDVQDFTPKHVPGVSAELALLQRERAERRKKAERIAAARREAEAVRRRFIARRAA